MVDLKLRPPRNRNEFIRMIGLYDSRSGLEGLLARFDLEQLPASHIERIVLGSAGMVPTPAQIPDPGALITLLLRSASFRRVVLRNVLETFKAKRRLIFVHVPKCAGSDLTSLLRRTHLAIEGEIGDPGWYSPDEMLEYLHDIVLGAGFVDDFLVCGHIPLPFYVDHSLIRPEDEVFTVVRDPNAIVVSQVNYMLTRLGRDPTGQAPDTRQWLERLGLPAFPASADRDGMVELGRRMLHDDHLVPMNILCRALGDGDAGSAIRSIVASDIEITDVTRYDAWLWQRWGIAESPRGNASVPYLALADLNTADRAVIARKTADDHRVHGAIMAQLSRGDAVSVRGSAIA